MKKVTPRRLRSLLALVAVPAIMTATFTPLAKAAPDILTEQTQNKQADDFYQRARADIEGSLGSIGRDYYITYRLVERIARANGLDEQPWRIRVTGTGNVNAYASNLNLLTFEGGLLEQVSGDQAALACVVGHEMAHHTENHIPIRVEARTKIEAAQREALEQARTEIETARRDNNIIGSVFETVTGTVGDVVGRNNSVGRLFTGPLATQIFRGLSSEETNQATARAEQLYIERIKELDEEYSEVLHAQESEADKVGYRFTVSAGFDPNGCARTIAVLEKTLHSRLPSMSHPRPEDRLADINALNTLATNQRLLAEGEENLRRSPNPLGYGVGRDGESLRVESRFGSQDIEDSFPQ